jgi:hypothetical protein
MMNKDIETAQIEYPYYQLNVIDEDGRILCVEKSCTLDELIERSKFIVEANSAPSILFRSLIFARIQIVKKEIVYDSFLKK